MTDRDRKWDACVAKMKEETQAIIVNKNDQSKTWIELRAEHERDLQEKRLKHLGVTQFQPLPQNPPPSPPEPPKSSVIHCAKGKVVIPQAGMERIRAALKGKRIKLTGNTHTDYMVAICKYKELPAPNLNHTPKKARAKFIARFLDELDGVPIKTKSTPDVRKPATVTLKDGSILGAVYAKPASQPIKRRETHEERQAFYDSENWRRTRYVALKRSRGVCELCGSAPSPGHPLHVDHIKPRSKYPELELDVDNLQILCDACNLGKGNSDEIDWRRSA